MKVLAHPQSGDRAVLEMFNEGKADSLEQQLVAHFVNPGEEVGGDSRLMSPALSKIRSQVLEVGGQVSCIEYLSPALLAKPRLYPDCGTQKWQAHLNREACWGVQFMLPI